MRIMEGPRVWMTPREFEAIWQTFFHRSRKRDPVEIIGVNYKMAYRVIGGERAVRKTEALAIAHWMMGFDPPPVIGDAYRFGLWFGAIFGDSESTMGDWLELPSYATLADIVRGHSIIAGKRVERTPGVALVRSIDWIRRCGPYTPFNRPDPCLEGYEP